MKQKIVLLSVLFYLLSGQFAHTQTLFPGQTLPDNIVNVGCYVSPPAQVWDISLLASGGSGVNNQGYILVGDVDGDGKTEIIAARNQTTNHRTSVLYVFNSSLNVKYTISTPEYSSAAPAFSIANVDGGSTAAIFLTTSITGNSPRQLIKYVFNGTTFVQSWAVSYSSNAYYDLGVPTIADFDNDGIAEVRRFLIA